MKKYSILAAIMGNIIEWYDFTLYVFLAPVIAHNFFTQKNHLNAMLSTFLIFAMGFFIRPLGSIILGHLGDRLGRKVTMLAFVLVTIAAKFSDKYGRRLLLKISAIGYLVLSVPCFYFLKMTSSWICLLPLVIFYCIEEATTPVTMVEIFPATARYTGISI